MGCGNVCGRQVRASTTALLLVILAVPGSGDSPIVGPWCGSAVQQCRNAAVSSHSTTSCAVTTDADLKCWQRSTATAVQLPAVPWQPLGEPTSVMSVSVGLGDGNIACMIDLESKELTCGDESRPHDQNAVPKSLQGISFTSVSAGFGSYWTGKFSCAIEEESGRIRCFDPYNQDLYLLPSSLQEVPFLVVRALSTSNLGASICALTRNNAIKCMLLQLDAARSTDTTSSYLSSGNSKGSLSTKYYAFAMGPVWGNVCVLDVDGALSCRATPSKKMLQYNYTSIAMGARYGSSQTYFYGIVQHTGLLVCFPGGSDSWETDICSTSSNVPAQYKNMSFSAISASGGPYQMHFCGILLISGQAVCWGEAYNAQGIDHVPAEYASTTFITYCPGFEIVPLVTRRSSTWMTVEWTGQDTGAVAVEQLLSDDVTWLPMNNSVTLTANSVNLTGLTPSTRYTLRCTLAGATTRSVNLTTLPELEAFDVTPLRKWQGSYPVHIQGSLPASTGNAVITNFSCSIDEDTKSTCPGRVEAVPANSSGSALLDLTIVRLERYKLYNVWCQVQNVAGWSSKVFKTFVTMPDLPGVMAIPRADTVSATEFKLGWATPNTGGSQAQDLRCVVQIWLNGSKTAFFNQTLPWFPQSYLVTRLVPGFMILVLDTARLGCAAHVLALTALCWLLSVLCVLCGMGCAAMRHGPCPVLCEIPSVL